MTDQEILARKVENPLNQEDLITVRLLNSLLNVYGTPPVQVTSALCL